MWITSSSDTNGSDDWLSSHALAAQWINHCRGWEEDFTALSIWRVTDSISSPLLTLARSNEQKRSVSTEPIHTKMARRSASQLNKNTQQPQNGRCRHGVQSRYFGMIYLRRWVFRQHDNFACPSLAETDWANKVKAHWPWAKMRANEIRIECQGKVIYPSLERREGLGL